MFVTNLVLVAIRTSAYSAPTTRAYVPVVAGQPFVGIIEQFSNVRAGICCGIRFETRWAKSTPFDVIVAGTFLMVEIDACTITARNQCRDDKC